MKNTLLLLAVFTLAITSCGRKKMEKTRFYQYSVNSHYTGAHPKSISANVFIKDKSISLEVQSDINGKLDTLDYQLYLYDADSTATYGYANSPRYSLGKVSKGVPAIAELETYFDEFTANYHGYFIVHDPLQTQSKDTTTLLFFAPIGAH